MKSIVALSSLALVSLSSVAPCLVVQQALSRSSEQSLPSQALPSAARSFQVVGFGLGDIINTVDRGLGIAEQEKRREEERKRRAQLEQERLDREAAQKKRQEELQAARQAASEKQRLEADRRQKYFESLSPAEKEAYLAKQRKQQEADQAALLFMLGILATGSGGSTAPQQGNSAGDEWRRNQPQPSAPQPTSQPGNSGGFYGNCHGGSAYGC